MHEISLPHCSPSYNRGVLRAIYTQRFFSRSQPPCVKFSPSLPERCRIARRAPLFLFTFRAPQSAAHEDLPICVSPGQVNVLPATACVAVYILYVYVYEDAECIRGREYTCVARAAQSSRYCTLPECTSAAHRSRASPFIQPSYWGFRSFSYIYSLFILHAVCKCVSVSVSGACCVYALQRVRASSFGLNDL